MNFVLKLSKLCNLRCTYCYEYDDLANKERMPLEGLERFFKWLAQHYQEQEWTQVLDFALHGGEPLLLPIAYLKALVALQKKYLGTAGIPYRNAAQTNLYRIPPGLPQALLELDIRLGVSLDVYGAQRVNGGGQDADARARDNLLTLLDSEETRPLVAGGITVMHAENYMRATDTFKFFQDLQLGYRILPIFSMTEPPARMKHLMLSAEQVVNALQQVALAKFAIAGESVTIYPLQDYLSAAVSFLSDRDGHIYDPRLMEWALIINTNGDVYNHSEAYEGSYCLGNAFQQPLSGILASTARQRLHATRAERIEFCDNCEFGQSCSRIPMIEALPSERMRDGDSKLRCGIAQPMISFMAQMIRANPAALAAVTQH